MKQSRLKALIGATLLSTVFVGVSLIGIKIIRLSDIGSLVQPHGYVKAKDASLQLISTSRYTCGKYQTQCDMNTYAVRYADTSAILHEQTRTLKFGDSKSGDRIADVSVSYDSARPNNIASTRSAVVRDYVYIAAGVAFTIIGVTAAVQIVIGLIRRWSTF